MNSTTNTTEPYFVNCTYQTCSVDEYGQVRYMPSLTGNALYVALFALLLIVQIFLGVRYRTWGFLVGMFGGLALEIVGYLGRILLHFDVFDFNNFIIYIVCLTIGPAFLAAAIYLCLARVIAIYGSSLSLFKTRTITCFFIFCDFVSLVLQAAGGAIASTSDDEAGGDMGVNIMIAGLATQVASMLIFVCLCTHFAWNVRRNSRAVNQEHIGLIESSRFRLFLWGNGIATLAILIRCAFRVAELSGGFGGSLANDEVSFMILEGAMIIIASIFLTAAHPGPVLGVMWKAGGFRLRKAMEVVLSGETNTSEVDAHHEAAVRREKA